MAPPRPPATPAKPTKTPYAEQLLQQAYPAATASAIHADKLKHKPLILHSNTTASKQPTFSTHSSTLASASTSAAKAKAKARPKDARDLRREARNAKLEAQGRRRRTGGSKRPQPLSASEKRRLCLYDVPKAERKYGVYAGLHALWCAYMREVLGMGPELELEAAGVNSGAELAPSGGDEEEQTKAEAGVGHPQGAATKTTRKQVYLTPQGAGPLLASADYHGAEVEVVRSRCGSRVGVRGIVLRDTKYTFQVITARDKVKTLPKEHSIFRFEVPYVGSNVDATTKEPTTRDWVGENVEEAKMGGRFVFELHGDQFQYRATDRANKKFKVHWSPDL